MVKTLLLVVYLGLMALFLFMAIFAMRHTLVFRYLSRRFKVLALIFAIIALTLVLVSLYMILALFHLPPTPEGLLESPSLPIRY